MIKEGSYPLHIKSLAAVSPKGVVGPWQCYSMSDFYIIAQAHLPPGVMWHPLEKVFAQNATITNQLDLNKLLQYNGVEPHQIRLNIQAYENLRRIFCTLNGFEYEPLPTGGKILPSPLELDWRGRQKRTRIKAFYEICYCGICITTRAEVARQKRVARGEEVDEDDNDNEGF